MNVLLQAALKANETALTEDGRLNARYILPELAPRYVGQLLMFLMYSIAYEGELAEQTWMPMTSPAWKPINAL